MPAQQDGETSLALPASAVTASPARTRPPSDAGRDFRPPEAISAGLPPAGTGDLFAARSVFVVALGPDTVGLIRGRRAIAGRRIGQILARRLGDKCGVFLPVEPGLGIPDARLLLGGLGTRAVGGWPAGAGWPACPGGVPPSAATAVVVRHRGRGRQRRDLDQLTCASAWRPSRSASRPAGGNSATGGGKSRVGGTTSGERSEYLISAL